MKFTDEDLKRLKEDLADRKDTHYETTSRMMIEEVEALLHRLEAGERLIWALDPHEGEIDKDFVRESRKDWIKSCGREE